MSQVVKELEQNHRVRARLRMIQHCEQGHPQCESDLPGPLGFLAASSIFG